MNNQYRIAGAICAAIAMSAATAVFAGDDYAEAAIARNIIEKSGITWEEALKRISVENAGVVYEYELDEDDDIFYHEFKMIDLDNKRKLKFKINAQTGEQRVKTSSYDSWWLRSDEDVLAAQAVKQSGFDIAQAVRAVAPPAGALLLEAELKQKHGVNFFEIEAIDDEGKREWLVDIDSQSLIPTFKR